MRVEYCPTGEMTGDFFTKPLQGAAFIKFRNRILNVNEDDLKQQQMLNLTDERLSKLSSHHRSVLDTNDKARGTKDRRNEREPQE